LNFLQAVRFPTRRALEGFVNISTVYDNINQAIALRAIGIRQQHNIKLPDSIIAATALVNNQILISRNTSDFQNIEGLQLINPYAL
jgi:predicted nucleic acid-binding protein